MSSIDTSNVLICLCTGLHLFQWGAQYRSNWKNWESKLKGVDPADVDVMMGTFTKSLDHRWVTLLPLRSFSSLFCCLMMLCTCRLNLWPDMEGFVPWETTISTVSSWFVGSSIWNMGRSSNIHMMPWVWHVGQAGFGEVFEVHESSTYLCHCTVSTSSAASHLCTQSHSWRGQQWLRFAEILCCYCLYWQLSHSPWAH